MIPDFSALPMSINLVVFGAAAAVVWGAGSRLARHANVIAERTGIGRAFMGLVLLGGVTSLPEAAVSVTAAVDGDVALAINNLLGGVAMQVAILAAGDLLLVRALSAVVVQPSVILQGAFGVLMLVVVAAAIALGELSVLGVGVGSLALVVLCGIGVWMAKANEDLPGWIAADLGRGGRSRAQQVPVGAEGAGGEASQRGRAQEKSRRDGLTAVVWGTVVAALAVVTAGFLLARTGEVIAEYTGLGSSFVGAVLVAISTSLPEISTVFAAIRIGQYAMAFSDIFGTNLFDIALIFVVDAFFGGDSALKLVGDFSLLAALLGAAATLVYIIGLIERRDRTLPRIGYDSLAVAVLYLSGLAALYRLR